MKSIFPIYFLKREGETPLTLYSPPPKQDLLDILENEGIQGWFGTLPSSGDIDNIKRSLYHLYDKAVSRWIDERLFYLRLVVCALTFLTMFFFLSYVIRDPIPLADEVLVSGGVTAVVYFLLRRRGRNSDQARKKGLQVRTAIDAIAFHHHQGLQELELYLDTLLALDEEELAEQMFHRGPPPPAFKDRLMVRNLDLALMDLLPRKIRNAADRLYNKVLLGKIKPLDLVSFLQGSLTDWKLYVFWKVLSFQ